MGSYWAMLAAQIRSQTQYRVSFAVDLGLNALISVLDTVALLLFFRVAPELGGFTLREALVVAGIAAVAFAVADLLVGNVERLPLYLRTGLLDAVLLRPLSALGQLVVIDASARRAGRVLQALTLYGIGLGVAGIHWTPARVLIAVVAPIAGTAIYAAIFVTGAAAMFWLIDGAEVVNSFTYGGRDFSYYPTGIYEGWFRRMFGYLLGLAFVAYLPALALLDHADPLGLPLVLRWVSPLVALLWVAVAACAWRFGVRHYRSTGS